MGGQLGATRVDVVMTRIAHDQRLALPCRHLCYPCRSCRPPPLFQVGQGSHVMHGLISLCATQLTGIRQQAGEQFVAAVPDGVRAIVKGRTGAPLQRDAPPLCQPLEDGVTGIESSGILDLTLQRHLFVSI
jgi:hypothetical protein